MQRDATPEFDEEFTLGHAALLTASMNMHSYGEITQGSVSCTHTHIHTDSKIHTIHTMQPGTEAETT